MSDKPVSSQYQWTPSPDGICEAYGNMLHLTWTLDDVRVRVAQLVGSPEARNPGPDFVGVAEERAAITLPWRMAKALRDQLTGVIDSFEKLNGEIKTDVKLPPSI